MVFRGLEESRIEGIGQGVQWLLDQTWDVSPSRWKACVSWFTGNTTLLLRGS